jgi:integrase
MVQVSNMTENKSKESHPYIFIPPERLGWIMQRSKDKKWNPASRIVNNLNRAFDVIRRKASVAKCTLHDLRRSAITNWAQKLPIQVVQQLAGHSDISTTRKYYLAVRPEDLVSASRFVNHILARTRDD